MKRGILIGAIVVLSVLLVWATVVWQPASPRPGALSQGPRGGDFTLQAASGPLALHDLRGKVVLLYFGYTMCPDICPTSLAFTAQGLNHLDKAEQEKVKMLFVTVDPERDTLERVKDYASFFHPSIIGLTGSPEDIARVARLYGASYARQNVDSAAGYVVDHTADTYVIAPAGKLFAVLPHGAPPAKVAETIRAALVAK
ncbi:MAG: SCO family protein [Sulfuricella sp.]|nr:SCO family protein [Sulfuricella sp.]